MATIHVNTGQDSDDITDHWGRVIRDKPGVEVRVTFKPGQGQVAIDALHSYAASAEKEIREADRIETPTQIQLTIDASIVKMLRETLVAASVDFYREGFTGHTSRLGDLLSQLDAHRLHEQIEDPT